MKDITIYLNESIIQNVSESSITWDDIKNYKVKKDWDGDDSYKKYLSKITPKDKELIINAFKAGYNVHPQIDQDISLNKTDDPRFISPDSSSCKQYLFTLTSKQLWEIIEELKHTNDGYEFSLEQNGYIHYVRKHNGIWY